jgi:hypothetical protein
MRHWMNMVETSVRDQIALSHDGRSVSVNENLFHATLESRVHDILLSGLQPRAENLQDSRPPRIYLTQTEADAVRIAAQLRKALVKGGVSASKEAFAILRVIPPSDHIFYADGYFAGGVFATEEIPPSAISIVGYLDPAIFLAKNWSRFWKWYFWKEGDQPVTGRWTHQYGVLPALTG